MQDAMAPTSTSVSWNVARIRGAFAEYAIAARLAADRIARDSTTPYIIGWVRTNAERGGGGSFRGVAVTSAATEATP